MARLPMSLSRALLYLRTARHLTPTQIGARPVHATRFALHRMAPFLAERLYPEPSAERCRRAGPVVALARDAALAPGPGLAFALARAERLVRGEVEYQGMAGSARPPIDWGASGRPKLWRYHLHYLDEAVDLAVAFRATGDPRFFAALEALVEDWIDHNPIGRGDGWEPYPLATRVLNGLCALDLVAGTDEAFDARAARSLARQALFLERHLEWHLLGNHLLRELCAVGVASCAFAGPGWEAIGARALARLRDAVAEQILPDGFHYERSPGYHVVVLADLAAVACASGRRGAVPVWLAQALDRMTAALRAVLHPDGDLPLLNDTAKGQYPPPIELLDPTSARARVWGAAPPVAAAAALPDAGLLPLRDGAEFLVFDHGAIGPRSQPGHAHSDTLGYELSHAGRRVLVDSGVGSYEAGEERDYFRSARAHNVVTVDLGSPDEMWAAFRVARRSSPGPCEVGVRDGVRHVRAEVRAWQGWTHRRDLLWDPGAGLAVRDRVIGAGDATVRTHLHLHPSLDAVADGEGFRVGDLRVDRLGGGAWEAYRGAIGPPRRGFCAERLGGTEPAWELALRADGAQAAYAVAWSADWKARAIATLDALDEGVRP